jgi:cephalosporin hydroxylase
MNLNVTNGSPGHFEFKSDFDSQTYSASQMLAIVDSFKEFLIREQFDILIELGTFKGGTTIILDDLRKTYDLSFKLDTYDIAECNDEMDFNLVKESFIKRGVNFLKTDVFSDETIKHITETINSNKKVCILCDGGNKVKEFNYFSDLLKSGDFIMAHDYFDDINQYDCPWSWREITHTEILPGINSNSLTEYTETRFPSVAWACYFK